MDSARGVAPRTTYLDIRQGCADGQHDASRQKKKKMTKCHICIVASGLRLNSVPQISVVPPRSTALHPIGEDDNFYVHHINMSYALHVRTSLK